MHNILSSSRGLQDKIFWFMPLVEAQASKTLTHVLVLFYAWQAIPVKSRLSFAVNNWFLDIGGRLSSGTSQVLETTDRFWETIGRDL